MRRAWESNTRSTSVARSNFRAEPYGASGWQTVPTSLLPAGQPPVAPWAQVPSAMQTAGPSSVQIGDFGINPDNICDDNTTIASGWRVEDAGGGNAKMITGTTTRDASNSIVSTGEVSYTIDPSGNVITEASGGWLGPAQIPNSGLFVFPTGGTYIVEATSRSSGFQQWPYTLTLSVTSTSTYVVNLPLILR